MFQDLGIDYFSLGSYVVPSNPGDKIRPSLPYYPNTWLTDPIPSRDDIPQSFIDNFDVIMIMHVPEWIIDNWQKFKSKTVVWRTIGQSTPSVERRLAECRKEGLKVVRYSPREELLKDNIGADAVVRFYKDPEEFNNWNGSGNEVLTFAQDMKKRGKFCNFDAFSQIVGGFNGHVYGPNNENADALNGGFLSYGEMKQKMRDARVYIYTGTQPASYTLNFIEAWMTGVPVISIGPKTWGTLMGELGINADLFEIPDLIRSGVTGFYSDDIGQIREWITHLMNDYRSAKRIGESGRSAAIEIFGKDSVRSQWKKFFDSL